MYKNVYVKKCIIMNKYTVTSYFNYEKHAQSHDMIVIGQSVSN